MSNPALEPYISIWKGLIIRRLPVVLSAVFITIAGMAIFQDYLEALRVDRAFYFSESLLFKTYWFLFIPMLAVVYGRIKKVGFTRPYSILLYIIIPVLVHYLLVAALFLLLSGLFYDGRYGLYKILSYTLANDLYKLIIVYSTFVLGLKYLSAKIAEKISAEGDLSETIVINNGKDNSIIKTSEIVRILAATPYVSIQLQNKKYLHTATLKSIHELLDPNDFIRVHRTAIVNKNMVVSFKSRLNGDYDLLLTTGEKTRLSRTYAANFKNAFASPHQPAN